MRKTIIVLAMLPLAAFAQKANKEAEKKELKSILVHYEEGMVINYDHLMVKNKPSKTETQLPGPGDLNFSKDDKDTEYLKFYTAAQHPEYDYGKMTAHCVTISSTAYLDLKGDKLIYDNLTDKAVLTGHVSVVDHGVEKQIGEIAYLDFTDNNYKIEGLK